MSTLGFLAALLVVATTSVTLTAQTRDEDVLRLNGTKVFLLPGDNGEFRIPGHQLIDKVDGPIIDGCLGKTAVFQASKGKNGLSVSVRVDGTGQVLTMIDAFYGSIGFFPNLESARALAGTELWNLGTLELGNPAEDQTKYRDSGYKYVTVGPVTKLKIVGADWGWRDFQIVLRLTTSDGKTGLLPIRGGESGGCFDLAYCPNRLVTRTKAWSPADNQFLNKDPHITFPAWSKDTWTLIQKGAVAVGMTEDMLKLACGSSYSYVGAILSGTGEGSSIYECAANRRFTMKSGKVTGFQ